VTSIALAVRAYQQSFEARPNTTLAITNGTLSALGDAVAQGSQIFFARPGEHGDRPTYDIARTLRFFTFGFGMGPLIGRWNKFLDWKFPLRLTSAQSSSSSAYHARTLGARYESRLPPVGPSSNGMAVMKRVAADQLFMAPIGLAIFIGSMGTMEGRDSTHIASKYSSMYSKALVANWQVWPLAQIVNFRYMPLPYRVPFQSTCGIFWNLYLSILNSSETEDERRTESIRKTLG